jgi:N-acyl-D-aspartate/D-glutamate deacylase
VIDGCGNPWFKADVAVKDGRIAKIGQISPAQAERVIDATNLIVSPGFIDAHAHSDITLLVNPKAESHIRQGITTQVIGLCGFSAAPLTDTRNLSEKMGGFLFQDVELYKVYVDWTTFREYFDRLEKQGIALNICSYVGHGTVRACVDLLENRAPSQEEMEKMKALVAEAMKDGAIGISTGLSYAPGCYAKTEEIVELCKVVVRYGGHYASHIRGYNVRIFEAVKEAMDIASACRR